MQKITPFLWYDGNAEEAVNFYVSIIARLGDAGYRLTTQAQWEDPAMADHLGL